MRLRPSWNREDASCFNLPPASRTTAGLDCYRPSEGGRPSRGPDLIRRCVPEPPPAAQLGRRPRRDRLNWCPAISDSAVRPGERGPLSRFREASLFERGACYCPDRGGHMTHYRCYLVGDTGRFAAVEELDAATDEIAVALARDILAKRPRKAAFELWELARQVHVEPLDALLTRSASEAHLSTVSDGFEPSLSFRQQLLRYARRSRSWAQPRRIVSWSTIDHPRSGATLHAHLRDPTSKPLPHKTRRKSWSRSLQGWLPILSQVAAASSVSAHGPPQFATTGRGSRPG